MQTNKSEYVEAIFLYGYWYLNLSAQTGNPFRHNQWTWQGESTKAKLYCETSSQPLHIMLFGLGPAPSLRTVGN